jgi:hypothetical protein
MAKGFAAWPAAKVRGRNSNRNSHRVAIPSDQSSRGETRPKVNRVEKRVAFMVFEGGIL